MRVHHEGDLVLGLPNADEFGGAAEAEVLTNSEAEEGFGAFSSAGEREGSHHLVRFGGAYGKDVAVSVEGDVGSDAGCRWDLVEEGHRLVPGGWGEGRVELKGVAPDFEGRFGDVADGLEFGLVVAPARFEELVVGFAEVSFGVGVALAEGVEGDEQRQPFGFGVGDEVSKGIEAGFEGGVSPRGDLFGELRGGKPCIR